MTTDKKSELLEFFAANGDEVTAFRIMRGTGSGRTVVAVDSGRDPIAYIETVVAQLGITGAKLEDPVIYWPAFETTLAEVDAFNTENGLTEPTCDECGDLESECCCVHDED
jgi:hypothetical protein